MTTVGKLRLATLSFAALLTKQGIAKGTNIFVFLKSKLFASTNLTNEHLTDLIRSYKFLHESTVLDVG